MKSKTIISLFASLAIFSCVEAQTIKWGPVVTTKDGSMPDSVIMCDSSGIYLKNITRPSGFNAGLALPPQISIEKINLPGMNVAYCKKISPTDKGSTRRKKMVIEGIYGMKHGMIMTVYGSDWQTLYAMKIKPDGTIDTNKTKIGTVYKKRKYEMPEQNYFFSITRDKKALVGAYINPTDQSKINLVAIDENMNIIWTKVVESPFAGLNFVRLFSIHSTDGNIVYLLGSYSEKEKSPIKGYAAMVFNYKSDAINETKIDLGDSKLHVNNAELDVDKAGDAVVTGFYGDEKSDKGSLGVFYQQLDEACKVQVNKHTPFTHELVSYFLQESQIAEGQGIENLSAFDLKLFVQDDGTTVLCGQQGVIELQQSFGLIFNYDNILVIKINPDGSMAWNKSVAFKQQGDTDPLQLYLDSYSVFLGKQKLYFFFNMGDYYAHNATQAMINGDSRDMDRGKLGFTGPENYFIVEEIIDMATGNVTRQPVADDSQKLMYYTQIYYQTNASTVYILKGDNGDHTQVGKVTIQ